MTDAWLIPQWPVPEGVRALVTTRQLPGQSQPPFDACNLGNRCGDDAAAVAANRAALVSLLDLPGSPRWLRQVHGTVVVDADDASAFAQDEPQADASVSRLQGVVLGILTADCLPVIFCAADGSQVAAAHAGWRGLAAGVLEATIARMRVPPDRILAWIGPAIGPASFEVGDEVRTAFVRSARDAASAFVPTRPGHWLCDLPELARQRLRAAGIGKVAGADLDTRTDPRFYSYRGDPRCGRFATLIWRV